MSDKIICDSEDTKEAMREFIWAAHNVLSMNEKLYATVPLKAKKLITKLDDAFNKLFSTSDLVEEYSDGGGEDWQRPRGVEAGWVRK